MRLAKLFRGSTVTLAALGMLLPHVAFGANPVAPAPPAAKSPGLIAMYDVALQKGGVLRGQVVDTQGAPAGATRVVLAQEGKVVAATQSDAAGRFEFAGVKGGVYQMATAQGGGMYRVWTPGAAPPAAHADALVIDGQQIVRGNMGDGGAIGFLANPWVLAAIVAAAIAIPLSLSNHNEGS
jgi:hypothetical protein